MRCCPVEARWRMRIPSLRSPYLRAGGCVSNYPQIRIAPPLDTHLSAMLTASIGKGIRIRQQLDTHSAETQYAFDRGWLRRSVQDLISKSIAHTMGN